MAADERPESAELAFARLTDREMDRCYSLAGYLLGNEAEAQDATQEAMALAWRARRTLRDPQAFESWLDRIVVNACMDRMRRRRVVPFVEMEEGHEVGSNGYGMILDSAETYRPATGDFRPTEPRANGHDDHTATLLADGRVLVAGGRIIVQPPVGAGGGPPPRRSCSFPRRPQGVALGPSPDTAEGRKGTPKIGSGACWKRSPKPDLAGRIAYLST